MHFVEMNTCGCKLVCGVGRELQSLVCYYASSDLQKQFFFIIQLGNFQNTLFSSASNLSIYLIFC